VYARQQKRSFTGVDQAQEMAIDALARLAQDPDRLPRFLAVCGLGPENPRQAAAEPGFPAAILTHSAPHDYLLIDFTKAAGHAPQEVAQARVRLIGEELGEDP
jgi:hypothetical protein